MIDLKLSRLNVVVLAAGFSRRMHQTKVSSRVHGTALLRRTIGVLTHLLDQPIVVVAPPRAAGLRVSLRGYRVRWLANELRLGGLSTSIVLALRRAQFSSGTLFLPADLPDLTPRDLSRLLARWRGNPRRVVARSLGGRGATPLVLPRRLYSRALDIVGDVGLRELIATLPEEERLLIELPSAVTDIDTPRELADARRRFNALRPYGQLNARITPRK